MEKTEQERLMNLAAEYEPERFAEITGGMMFVNTKENRRRAWVTIGYGEPGYTVYFFVHSAARGSRSICTKHADSSAAAPHPFLSRRTIPRSSTTARTCCWPAARTC
jgi:hypothetical protein